VAPAAGAPAPLLERLRELFPGVSGRTLRQWLVHGRVEVDGAVLRRGDAVVPPGARVRLAAAAPEFPRPLRLVHEDADVLVVDKPAGLLTIATERERHRTAYRLLADYVAARREPGARLFVVHRLDRETSGLLVFAKSAGAKRALQAQFERRRVERVYVALVEGRVQEPEGTLQSRLETGPGLRVRPARGERGREAITHYRVLERRGDSTLLRLTLTTGRRGQIRAQLAALGHPVVGDAHHGSRRRAPRVLLHATRLGFVHPRGQPVAFTSAPPPPLGRRGR
jgi:23S rRNA pseudouridine1911/1915/1917 synthase